MAATVLRVLAGLSFVLALILAATAKGRGDTEWVGPIIAAAFGIVLLTMASVAARRETDNWNREQDVRDRDIVAQLRATVEEIGYYRIRMHAQSTGGDESTGRVRAERCVRLFLKAAHRLSDEAAMIERLVPGIAAEGGLTGEPIALNAALHAATSSHISYRAGGAVLPLAETPQWVVRSPTTVLRHAFPDWYKEKSVWLTGQHVNEGLVMSQVLGLLLLAQEHLEEITSPDR